MNKGEDHLGSGVHVQVNKEDNTEADETGVQLDRKRELLLAVAWWVCLVQRGPSLDSTNVYEGGGEEE